MPPGRDSRSRSRARYRLRQESAHGKLTLKKDVVTGTLGGVGSRQPSGRHPIVTRDRSLVESANGRAHTRHPAPAGRHPRHLTLERGLAMRGGLKFRILVVGDHRSSRVPRRRRGRHRRYDECRLRGVTPRAGHRTSPRWSRPTTLSGVVTFRITTVSPLIDSSEMLIAFSIPIRTRGTGAGGSEYLLIAGHGWVRDREVERQRRSRLGDCAEPLDDALGQRGGVQDQSCRPRG